MAILKLQPVTVCTVERQNPANLEAGGAACAPALTLRIFPFPPGSLLGHCTPTPGYHWRQAQ